MIKGINDLHIFLLVKILEGSFRITLQSDYLFVALKFCPQITVVTQIVILLEHAYKSEGKLHKQSEKKMTAKEMAVPGVLQIYSLHCRFNDSKIIHIYERK